ncbi:MAG: DUF2079 domain-containing protein [Chloroflexi bacterium]|nr:DUF2079 domain-containing protein [Chloroflexota bacterium]
MAFDLHAGMRTHQSDLGQIDQAIWNTSRGRLLEFTKENGQSVRFTDHVEPIFALISPLFWLWDDVRALLLLQVVLVALGAWPLFELARRKLGSRLALALAAAYLLNAQLQSAVLTEFHAIPLAVPLILWAFWAVEEKRWGQFALAALLVAAVKEEAALLAAGLGLWAAWRAWRAGREQKLGTADQRGVAVGAILLTAALIWFYVATFVIVPAYAAEAYGVEQSTYFNRYGALGDSPLDIVRSMLTRPGLVWQIATEPARLRYVFILLAGFGFLSLLGLDVLALALPVLLANLLSAFPAQYYGEFHYSAPLTPYFAVAATYGMARLLAAGRRWRRGQRSIQRYLPTLLAIWLLAWAGASYVRLGRGPLGGRYDPATITAHHRLLERFTAQIPQDAAVSATAAIHPHISHRRFAYKFPAGLEADPPAQWALIDVTGNTDMAPGDLRETVMAMLAGDWGVEDGADGYLLLRRGSPNKAIPDAFYDFVRARGEAPTERPLTFLGLDVIDWPAWRQTRVLTRWLVGENFAPETVRPWLELRAPNGELLYTFDDMAPPALIWHPPNRWRPGDVISIETMGLFLPAVWGAAVGVVHGPNPFEPASRLPIDLVMTESPWLVSSDNTLALVGAYRRIDERLRPLKLAPDNDPALRRTRATFLAPNGQALSIDIWTPNKPVAAGRRFDVYLRWSDALPEKYALFVHLRDGEQLISQSDGPPRVFIQTENAQPIRDWRQLSVPNDSPAGKRLSLVFGLYDYESGARLPWVDASGQIQGDEFPLGAIVVAPPPIPDQACALAPQTCD